ncbi:MAG: ATP-grasp domain-containing protein, partial [Zetaproteobacteria bacterium]|nr:ATP-grasp domain-containing protein [Zetaproteobacteria bacterium]
YVGIDIVLGDQPYIVDVNPRPTTSIIGMGSVIDAELGQLIVDARYGRLPDGVGCKGAYSFRKKDIM